MMVSFIKQLTVLVLITITFVLSSCKDKGTEPTQTTNDFNGMVKDELGNPVPGVSVYLIYDEALVPLIFNNESIFSYCPKTVLDTLPVELTSFSASASGQNIQLRWSTATEHNVHGYEIERRQNDTSVFWNIIGFVEGSGNSNSTNSYSYTDTSVPAENKYYYRLKIILFDGSFSYSGIVEVNIAFPLVNRLSPCYPNPFTGATTNIQVTIPGNSKISLKILDYKKSIIKRTLIDDFILSSFQHTAGNYTITFNDSSKIMLGNGIYEVQYIVQSLSNGKIDTLYSPMCKLDQDIAALQKSETGTVSGNDGKFMIPYDNFYINASFVCTTPDGPDPSGIKKFTNTPTIVLMKNGYQPFFVKTNVDNSSNPEESFVLKKIK